MLKAPFMSKRYCVLFICSSTWFFLVFFIGIYGLLHFLALQVVKVALDVHTSEKAGDILVFLTGK